MPAGTGYTFTVAAKDVAGTLIYSGAASNVTILRGQTVMVIITAQQANPSIPFCNAIPIIDSLVVSSTKVAPGDQMSVKVSAHDPNPQDTLTLQWQASCGTFADPSATNTNWTAPASVSSCLLSIKVSDQHGATVVASATVNVDSANGKGQAQVSVTTNTWPVITDLAAAPNGWLEARHANDPHRHGLGCRQRSADLRLDQLLHRPLQRCGCRQPKLRAGERTDRRLHAYGPHQ